MRHRVYKEHDCYECTNSNGINDKLVIKNIKQLQRDCM